MDSNWATVSTKKKTGTGNSHPPSSIPKQLSMPRTYSERGQQEAKVPLYKATRATVCAQNAQVKWGAASNKQSTPAVANPSKLDQETEELKHNRITREMGILIQKGRQMKGWSQKDLAMKINEKPQVIMEYESARGVRNHVIISKIENALGMKIR